MSVRFAVAVLAVAAARCAVAECPSLLEENFDGASLKWQGLGCGWSVEPKVGSDGSNALVWRTPKNGTKPALLQYPLTAFRPGMKLEVSCRAKVLEAGTKPAPAQLCDIEWWGLDGKWAGGVIGAIGSVPATLRKDGSNT